jgi:hypothetical protein
MYTTTGLPLSVSAGLFLRTSGRDTPAASPTCSSTVSGTWTPLALLSRPALVAALVVAGAFTPASATAPIEVASAAAMEAETPTANKASRRL